MIWKPDVTVAAVVERDGHFLLVEEKTTDGVRLNQPAGHLEPNESIVDAVVRETLEETAHDFAPTQLTGIYRWTRPASDLSYLRFAFSGQLGEHHPKRSAGALTFHEQGRGPNSESGRQRVVPELLGDVVLARKEMPASYHLSVVVDDALQGVSLVTRGEDLFHATHIQRLLQSLLGLAEPNYAHHRLITDRQGKKFSKRDTSVTLRALREQGVSAEEIRKQIGLAVE